MIISQTPLRVSFVGGGTDFPAFFLRHSGKVVSCAIDKYVYVIVKERYDDKIYVNYSIKEIVDSVDEIKHELIREALRIVGIRSGIEITTLADIPSEGSGLGSSSAVAVGVLRALYAFRGDMPSNDQIAAEACEIEIDRCRKPIGKQDQYICTFGGLRSITFHRSGQVCVRGFSPEHELEAQLDERLMLFYTGMTRSSAIVLREQNANIEATYSLLQEMSQQASVLEQAFDAGNVEALPCQLRMGWDTKRKLTSGISSPLIDHMANLALGAGASAVKLCGAGGGGFLLVSSEPAAKKAVCAALSRFREMPFVIDRFGSRIMLNVERRAWKTRLHGTVPSSTAIDQKVSSARAAVGDPGEVPSSAIASAAPMQRREVDGA